MPGSTTTNSISRPATAPNTLIPWERLTEAQQVAAGRGIGRGLGLIPWERLTEAQQNYLAVNLIRINDATGDLEVSSEYLDGHDLLDYFTPAQAPTEQPTL